MNQIDQIKAEIKRLIQEFRNIRCFDAVDSAYKEGRLLGYKDIKNFINSLPEEKPSEDLEKAAEKYTDNPDNYAVWTEHFGDFATVDDIDLIERAFKAGAQWQKERAIKDIPKWRPAARAYLGDRLPKMDHSLNRVVARDETGAYYLTMDDLYKLPKEDEK